MEEKEVNIDLSLSLGDSTQFVETGLKSNNGVGANAGSKINMAFAASDPLSELVWSPNNGLSLRCADSTFAATKPLLLWNVGPSNPVLPLPENIRTREDNDHKSGEEEPFIVADVESPVNQKLDKEVRLATSSQRIASPLNSRNQIENTSNDMIDITPESNVLQQHPNDEANNVQNIVSGGTAIGDYNADQVDRRNKHFPTERSSDFEMDLSLSKPSSNKLYDNDVPRSFEVQCRLQYEPVRPLQCISPSEGAEKATLDTKKESENKVSNDDLLAGTAPLERMDSSAENILPDLVRTEVLEQTAEKQMVNSSLLKASPTKSWMDLYQKKGKGKVLYDGEISMRLSNDVEDSHESVESCNSSGFSAKGKRRLNPAESTIDSKRAKAEHEDELASSLPTRHDSSFMTWISNMVKGYRESTSLDLRLDQPDWQKDSVQDIVACSKKSDDGYIGTGFQSMLQSLYSTASRKPDPQVSEPEYLEEASEHLVLAANSRPGNIPALAYLSEKEQCCERSLFAEENTDAATSRNLVLPSELQIVPVNAAIQQEVHETNMGSNKDGSRFFDRLIKERNSIPDKSSPNLLSKNKTANHSGKNSTLGSLWITRFCAKDVSASMNLDEVNKNEIRGNTDLSRFNYIQISSEMHNTRNTLGITENLNEKEGNDLQNDLELLSENVEESAANNGILGHNHRNSFHNVDTILPSTICKNPDEIASIFARRLDALKQISLSDTKGDTPSQMATCLFCGKYGHELRYCSDITKSELEALLCNASSHARAEGSSFCIICFQLDHWANTCPKKSTRREQMLDTYNSIGNINVKLCEGDDQDSTIVKKREWDPLYDNNLNLPSRNKPLVYPEIDNLTGTGADPSGRRITDGNEVRKSTDSKLGEHVSRRRQPFPVSNFVGRQIEAVPEGMLDAIKRLRLSRVEILKCMNSSHISLSYLNGFFIRLRIGKLEAGQGRTGYYVASLTGEQRELSAKDSKKCIAVNVGGTRSLVGVQYVSNHDFLEDEVVTWWCRALQTGEKVPSQGELKSKFEERIKFGFC